MQPAGGFQAGVLEVTIQQNQKAYEAGIYIDLWIFLWWMYVALYLQLSFETNHWGGPLCRE